jgi:plasmid maintenance system killer protein
LLTFYWSWLCLTHDTPQEATVIAGYKSSHTERFARGEQVKEFESFAPAARRRLAALSSATSLRDLAAVANLLRLE